MPVRSSICLVVPRFAELAHVLLLRSVPNSRAPNAVVDCGTVCLCGQAFHCPKLPTSRSSAAASCAISPRKSASSKRPTPSVRRARDAVRPRSGSACWLGMARSRIRTPQRSADSAASKGARLAPRHSAQNAGARSRARLPVHGGRARATDVSARTRPRLSASRHRAPETRVSSRPRVSGPSAGTCHTCKPGRRIARIRRSP